MTTERVTQEAVEVLVEPDPDLRVTQTAVEVLVQLIPDMRVTQQAVEVLISNAPTGGAVTRAWAQWVG